MKLRDHTIIAAATGAAAYLATKSPGFTAGIVLSGIFIDLDHFYDYFRNVAYKIDIRDFFYKCHNYEFKKLYVPLHSYEFLVLLALVGCFYPAKIILGALAGSSIHLLADLLYNKVYFFTYSFAYRLSEKFDSKVLFRPPYGQN